MKFEILDHAGADDARRWLALNRDNRPMSNLRANQYATAMLRGEWRHTNDAITVEGDLRTGRLQNGQHRARALEMADERQPGITVPMHVIYELGPDSAAVMNVGKPWTVADHLAYFGMTEASPQYLSGALTLAWHVAHGTYVTRQPTPSRVELLEFLKNDAPDLPDVVPLGITTARGAHIPHTGVSVAYWLAGRAGHVDRLEEFAHDLATGENLSTEAVAWQLRERFARWAITKHSDRMRPWKVCAVTVSVWNAYIQRKPLKVSQVRATRIPEAL